MLTCRVPNSREEMQMMPQKPTISSSPAKEIQELVEQYSSTESLSNTFPDHAVRTDLTVSQAGELDTPDVIKSPNVQSIESPRALLARATKELSETQAFVSQNRPIIQKQNLAARLFLSGDAQKAY